MEVDLNSGEHSNPWQSDLLGYERIGETFTSLLKSIDDSKVISIEAGFGRGKTFFRKAWAAHLRKTGEVVIEIDAQQSDHSNDPVITFLAALMETLEPSKRSSWTKAIATGTGVAIGAAKIAAGIAARKAGEEAIEGITEWFKSEDDNTKLDAMIAEFGEEASKALGAQLTAQIAAERVRTQDLPTQMMALRKELTKNADSDRVVVLIDELDRCHPEYAIALLEAMKLVFDQDGYVFVLMANSEHLERLSEQLFGKISEDEKYLDKFVDIRLQLPASDNVIGQAAYQLVKELPLDRPFADGPEFSLLRAAELAQAIAPLSQLSMRQIKRVLLKVEVAIRCYNELPLDAPLLVFLAFQEAMLPTKLSADLLPRSRLSKSFVDSLNENESRGERGSVQYKMRKFIHENCRELLELPDDRYRSPPNSRDYYDWAKVMHLAEHYPTSHTEILNAIHQIAVEQ